MVDTLKKKIENDKVIANKKAREKAKAETEKKKTKSKNKKVKQEEAYGSNSFVFGALIPGEDLTIDDPNLE